MLEYAYHKGSTAAMGVVATLEVVEIHELGVAPMS